MRRSIYTPLRKNLILSKLKGQPDDQTHGRGTKTFADSSVAPPPKPATLFTAFTIGNIFENKFTWS